MSKPIDTGGPGPESPRTRPAPGMTLRDYAAIQFTAALLSNQSVVGFNAKCGWGYVNCDETAVAGQALAQADAMIAALPPRAGGRHEVC